MNTSTHLWKRLGNKVVERVRPILERPSFYELHNTLIGAAHRNRFVIQNYIRPCPSDRILDIGCGPGSLLPSMPPCNYVGVDMNPSYIAMARRRFGDRAQFECSTVSEHTVQQFGEFDIVLGMGVLHHLNDVEAEQFFRLAISALKTGGRFITHDGCYTPFQTPAARYMLSIDRGRYVRTEEQYVAIAKRHFRNVQAQIHENLLRIPYTHLVIISS